MEQIIESFFSKVGEKLVNYGLNKVSNEMNFMSTSEILERNLKSLSTKAYDVEEEIRIVELSGIKKRKREVENWLKQVKIIENEFHLLENEVQADGFIKQFFGGDRPIKLNARVCELVEQSRHFGELLLDDSGTRGEAFLTTRLVGEAFEENLKMIWRFLVDEKVSSIGIYGMGGVGKSALAKHINNRLLERMHEYVLWVTISQDCSIMMLQDKIARVLRLKLSDEYDEDKRAARLNRALSLRTNFVLILDDIWRYINLEKVGVPHFGEDYKLIITTRSLEVCRQIGCQEMIAAKPLHADEGWKLFREKLGQETTLAPRVQDIAMSVAKVCNGLPLGIITLAGSMRGVTDIHAWRNALTVLQKSVMGYDEMDDQVFKVLKYSFDRLEPNHQRQGKRDVYTTLQQCFLYCSLYPEDYKIRRDKLVRKFISEELMDQRKSTEAQLDEGYTKLNRLVNVSLLESASILKEGDSVKMHDLVRAMALKITEDKAMVVAGKHTLKKIQNEEEWMTDLEKISLMENRIEEIPLGMAPNCPKLSTLLLQSNPLRLIPGSFFSRLRGLCILDLSETCIKELPNSLSDLNSLKALLLGGCQELEYVPYLGKLKALKELDLSGTAIGEVPKGTEKLVELKYLSINGAKHLDIFPTGLLLNLPCLQLLRLSYRMQAPLGEVERLKQLEEFEGRVKDMDSFNRFIESRQSKQHSVSYCIMVGEFKDRLPFFALEICKRINKLIVYKYDFRKEKDVIILAEDIQYLEFFKCAGLSNCLLDYLSNPRSLEKLEIVGCEGIECILTYEQFTAPQELESRFQSLQEIMLRGAADFMGVIMHKQETRAAVSSSAPSPPAAFSSLRSLSISKCNRMKKLGLPMSVFQKLEYIFIGWCEEIEEIMEEVDDHGRSGDQGEALVCCLPRLKCLRLIQLPGLKSISKVTMICSSIEIINLEKCPALKKLPLYFPPSTAALPHAYSPPPALKKVELHKEEKEWWDSLEWDHPTHSHLLQPFLHFW